LLRSTQHIN